MIRVLPIVLLVAVLSIPTTTAVADCDDIKASIEDALNEAGVVSAKIIVTGCTTTWRKRSFTCRERKEEMDAALRRAFGYYKYRFLENDCQRTHCINVPISGRTHMEWISEGHRC